MCLTDEFLLFLITVSPDNGPVFEEETDKPLNIFLPSLYSEIYSILWNADIICVVVQRTNTCSKPTTETQEKGATYVQSWQWSRFGVFIVEFKHILLFFLLLGLSRQMLPWNFLILLSFVDGFFKIRYNVFNKLLTCMDFK